MKLFALTLALAAFCAPCLSSAVVSPISAEQTTRFQARDGSLHTLAELRGQPAVVNFWATWCGPCRDEMPRLQKLAEQYQAQGVRFIAISLDAPETQGKIDALLTGRGFHLPVWTGATEATLSHLQLGVFVPATLILDSEGEVVGKIEGEARDKDVRSRLDWLLHGRQGRQPGVVQKNDW